ncbi:MAG: GntR family transcriptional regulator [Bacilli bacterium]
MTTATRKGDHLGKAERAFLQRFPWQEFSGREARAVASAFQTESAAERVEKELVKRIIAGKYPVGGNLPAERELSQLLGVSRPTVREALQNMERAGWVAIRKGQPATVQNYRETGNLGTLVQMIRHGEDLSPEFVVYFLELRCLLAPVWTREAVRAHPARVVAELVGADVRTDLPGAFAELDFRIQKSLAKIHGNPLYLMLLNSFDEMFRVLGARYFSYAENREHSRLYYANLLSAAMAKHADEAERLTEAAMMDSVERWKNLRTEGAGLRKDPP